MKIHFSLNEIQEIISPVVTMGSFDGVHAGHRVIISRLNTLAREAGGSSVLITFSPHPRKVLYPETTGKSLRLISTLEEKCHLLDGTGLDHLFVLEFTRDFSRITAEDFLEEYLVAKLHPHTIVVGFNHFFGHNKAGNFDSLYQVREMHGFNVEEIPEQEIQHETVSSTKIRKALSEGHIQRANAYLEHHFIIKAPLEFLSTESRELKRSTYAVQVTDSNKLLPPVGSYAVSLRNKGETVKALLRISSFVTFLYPLAEFLIQEGKSYFIHFHKHLEQEQLKGIESELAEIEELIY